MSEIKKVIVDVDMGIDDYVAVLLLLAAEKAGTIKIEGIHCTSGNTSLEHVTANTIRLLELIGRTDIPVYRGGKNPIIPPLMEFPPWNGVDGFGDLTYDHDPDLSVVKPGPSAVAMGELVVNNPNEITLVAVAPLTNVGLAVKMYEDFASSLKELWIMGGNYQGVGNTTKAAEFNVLFDPEAAYAILENVPCPVIILPWEACLGLDVTYDWLFNDIGNKTPELDLLLRALKNIVGENDKDWIVADAFLAAAFISPNTIIKRQNQYNASIELHGSQTRGQVVLDHLKERQPNVTIIEQIDDTEFKAFVEDSLVPKPT